MIIERKKLFTFIRSLNGGLTQTHVNALVFILDKLDADEDFQALPEVTRKKYFAYILATIFWETAHSFLPIKEMGGESYLRRKKYYPFYGRGYVQLTWLDNYRRFGKFLGIDLEGHPEYAYDREIAWSILKEGMTDKDMGIKDPEFTAYSLEDFFTETKTDWVGARKIINGKDKANAIADIAIDFYDNIEFVEKSAEAIDGEDNEASPEPFPAERSEDENVA